MTWDELGGNPAPGDVWAIRNAATALRTIAGLTGGVADSMNRNYTSVSGAVWEGAAYDAYLNTVQKVLPEVQRAETSYTDAAGALDGYATALEEAQFRASNALREADQAQADWDQAESNRSNAQSASDSSYNDYQHTVTAVTRLNRQLAATPDPGLRTTLTSQILNLEAAARNQWANRESASADASQFTAARNDANDRLTAARNAANAIRADLDAAADQAVAQLKASEVEAHLPGLMARMWSDTTEFAAHWAPVIKSVLEIVGAVVGVLSIFIPALVAVSLAIAVVVLVVDFLAAMNDGHISGSEWAGLGLDALGLLSPAGGAAKRWVLKDASSTLFKAAGVADKWSWIPQDIAGSANDAVHHNWGGLGIDLAGGFVTAGAASKWSGPTLRHAFSHMNDNHPVVSAKLQSISRLAGQTPRTKFVDRTKIQGLQTLLGASEQHPSGGQFLPGSTGGLTATDRALSNHNLDEQLRDTAPDVADHLKDGMTGTHDLIEELK